MVFLIFTLIINRTDNPGFQLSWTALVLLLPVFGGLLYLYVEVQPGTKYMKACLKEIDEKTKGSTPQDKKCWRSWRQRRAVVAQLAGYIRKVADYPVYKNTKVTYFPRRGGKVRGSGSGAEPCEEIHFSGVFYYR